MEQESIKSFIKKLFIFDKKNNLTCWTCGGPKPENGEWACTYVDGECYCTKECYHKSATYEKEQMMWA